MRYISNILLTFLTIFFVSFFVIVPLSPVLADTGMPKLQIDIPTIRFSPANPCTTVGDESKLCVNWIAEYIAGIYKYAIGIVGILATVVMMIGGVMWIMSGGNASTAGEAKSWITSSLTGLIIALSSYMILYQVNPALVIWGPIKVEVVKPRAGIEYTAGDTCSKYGASAESNNKIDFFTTETMPVPSRCSNYNFSGYGVNEKILKSIAIAESSCRKEVDNSVAGACGIMQLLPSTAGQTCEWLKANPQESIGIAAKYITDNAAKHSGDRFKIWAGYNSGYGTGTSGNGTKGALAPSTDCPGQLAYECCINPGGLSETQDYVFKAIRYYNAQ